MTAKNTGRYSVGQEIIGINFCYEGRKIAGVLMINRERITEAAKDVGGLNNLITSLVMGDTSSTKH